MSVYSFPRLPALLAFFLVCATSAASADAARAIIVKAILADSVSEKRALVGTLAGQSDEAIQPLFAAWRESMLFIHESPQGVKTPVLLRGEKDDSDAQEAVRVIDGELFVDAAGKPIRLVSVELIEVEHDGALRRAMRGVLDIIDLSTPDVPKRRRAVEEVGRAQDLEKLPALQARIPLETDRDVQKTLREAIALTQLKSTDVATKLSALRELKELHPLPGYDFLVAAHREAIAAKQTEIAEAARQAVRAVEDHRTTVNFLGTLFRGVSSGSVLLVAALGLAITFGLMRVINMAHGEMIAVGAYTTYVVQNIFGSGLALSPFGVSISLPGLNATGFGYQSYFLCALPLSFLTAAAVGIILERSVIQFLYRRPLESLLATWGVSLVLQQLFKLIFGSNNVQVSSPVYLSGNWTAFDVVLGWNRLFVIAFAILIVLGVWLVLTKTPLGLLMRAVMQNRGMASCMGVRTERVNMLTFGLGSGLAGLAGAFLSQLGNVGPLLGQNYIIDCFMTVVVGGVGSIAGTIVAASGIGMTDQSLQQIFGNPVLGKILVLIAIILFLQWRPAGLFVTRSRSLDE